MTRPDSKQAKRRCIKRPKKQPWDYDDDTRSISSLATVHCNSPLSRLSPIGEVDDDRPIEETAIAAEENNPLPTAPADSGLSLSEFQIDAVGKSDKPIEGVPDSFADYYHAELFNFRCTIVDSLNEVRDFFRLW